MFDHSTPKSVALALNADCESIQCVCGSVRRLSDTALICALGLELRPSVMLLIHHSLDGRAMLFVLAERYLAMATMLKPIMCKPPGCCNCSSARLLLMIQDALNKHSTTRIFLALFQILSRTVPANALSPAPDTMTRDGQRPTIGAPTLRIAGPDKAPLECCACIFANASQTKMQLSRMHRECCAVN